VVARPPRSSNSPSVRRGHHGAAPPSANGHQESVRDPKSVLASLSVSACTSASHADFSPRDLETVAQDLGRERPRKASLLFPRQFDRLLGILNGVAADRGAAAAHALDRQMDLLARIGIELPLLTFHFRQQVIDTLSESMTGKSVGQNKLSCSYEHHVHTNCTGKGAIGDDQSRIGKRRPGFSTNATSAS
jgi:hypothetical protein